MGWLTMPKPKPHKTTLRKGCWFAVWCVLFALGSSAPEVLAQFPPQDPQKLSDINFAEGFGARGGRYTFAITDLPRSLNPLLAANDFASQQAAQLAGVTVFPSMLDGFFEEPIRLTDGIALFEIDDLTSPTRVIMRLRRGVKWSDGSPIDANDAAFTFAAYTDARYADLAGTEGLRVGGQWPGFERVDETSWAYTLPQAVNVGNYLVQLNRLTLLPQHAHQAAFDSGALATPEYWSSAFALAHPKQIVGAGPFRLFNGTADQEWVFERNPYYWKVDGRNVQLPYFNAVRMVLAANETEVLLRFLNGELDQITPRAADLPVLFSSNNGANVGLEVLPPAPNGTSNFLTFNQDIGLHMAAAGPVSNGDAYLDSLRQLFRQKLFRRAVSKAINRQRIVQDVFLGLANPIFQMAGLGAFDISGHPSLGRPPDPDYPTAFFSFSVEEANQMLDQLNLPLTAEGVRVFGDSYPAAGQRVSIELQTNQEDEDRVSTLALLKRDLEQVGLVVRTKALPFGSILQTLLAAQELSNGQPYADWQAVYLGIGGGGIDPTVALSPLVSSSPLHFYRYSDALDSAPLPSQTQMDLLWLKQADLPSTAQRDQVAGLPGWVYRSPPERFAQVKQLQLLLADQQDFIFTVAAKRLTAYYKNRLGNVVSNGYQSRNPQGSLLSFFEAGYRKDLVTVTTSESSSL